LLLNSKLFTIFVKIKVMEVLKVDKTKLQTVANYAKEQGVTRQTIYLWAKDPEKKIKIVTIDGFMFVEKQ
jgi:hypothetical protein